MSLDLSKLSKDDKIKLYESIVEVKRRQREAGRVYLPNLGQSQVHECSKANRALFSGNGAGKTALGCNEAIYWAQGFNPITKSFTKVPARIIVLLDHPEKVADKWLPELRKWTIIHDEDCHKRGKAYYNRITWPTGSEFLFMFHDQTDLQFESIEADYIIFDEPPPRRVYIALMRGLRNKNREPRVLILGTPITGAWMRKEIQQPWARGELPDWECFTFGTEVNRANLADGYIEKFSRVLSQKEREVRLQGKFYDLDGAALSHLFDRNTHIIDPFDWPEDWPTVVSIDPHPTKPHHACLVGCDKDGFLYYIKELKAKAVASDFAKILKEFYSGYRVSDITHDSIGEADGTGGQGFKSFSQVLRENGVLTRATTWDDKQDQDFIERVRSALHTPTEKDNFGNCTPRLRIFRGNPGIVNDIENVQWLKMRNHDEFKPKLDISDTDYLSCLKYALATNISPLKGKAAIHRPTVSASERYGVRKETSPSKIALKRTFNLMAKKRPTFDDW